MGIPFDESGVNNECTTCFDVDATPNVIWLFIYGVKKGTGWTYAMGPCPNGVFKLRHDFGCVWDTTIGTMHYKVELSGATPAWWAKDSVYGFKFLQGNNPHCQDHAENVYQTPGSNAFYDGSAYAFFTDPYAYSKMVQPALAMNIQPDPETFIEPFPFTEYVNIFRYANKKDSVRCKIKFDSTP